MAPTKGRPKQPGPRQASVDLSTSSPNAELNATGPSPQHSLASAAPALTAHSPRKGARIGFLVKFRGLGGSPEDEICSDEDKPTRLKRVHRKATDGWTETKIVSTYNVWQAFDKEHHDYISPSYNEDDRVRVIYSGHPGDRPRDVRARPFHVEWAKPQTKSRKKQSSPFPVFRVTFFCQGNCDPVAETSSSEEEDMDDELDADTLGDSNADVAKRPSRPKKKIKLRCSSRAKLTIEVLSDDLSKAHVWLQNHSDHPRVRPGFQAMSHYIRLGIYECAQLRMTAGKIKQRLKHVYETYNVPKRRCATGSQIKNIVQHSQNKERLDKDPIKAIGLFANANPDRVFNYEIHDPESDPPKRFSAGTTDDWSLETLLLYGGMNGTALDSSSRHKNEQRAPVTFFVTVNNQQHMVPGAAYLSEDAQGSTIAQFLRSVARLVLNYARKVVKDPSCILHGRKRHQNILDAAHLAIQRGFWEPSWIMIDKSRPEVLAILWPNVPIRLCQFHVIQAILRWDRDTYSNADSREYSNPRFSTAIKRRILWAFREMQRCRREEDWPQYRAMFETRLRKYLAGTDVSFARVWGYFTDNWFTDEWRSMWTDMGIPDTNNRDGMLNTNNWVERAFKTFDNIFLDCRSNKRLDRLFIIIANEFLPFYREWEPSQGQRNNRLIMTIKNAHRTWSTKDMIIQRERDVWEVSELATNQNGDSDSDDDEDPPLAFFVLVERQDGVLTCGCQSFTQTGRSCVHIWSVWLYLGNGDVEPYLEHETVRAITGKASRGYLKATPRKKSKGLKVHDKLIGKEIDAVLKDLEDDRTFDVTNGEDDNDLSNSLDSDSAIGTDATADDPAEDVNTDVRSVFTGKVKPGRGPNTAPMQPWRSGSATKKKSTTTPKEFAKKPGRKSHPAGSLLPALTVSEKKASKASKRHTKKSGVKTEAAVTSPEDGETISGPIPSGFTGEETALLLGNISQISQVDHKLRHDVMFALVDILNELSVKLSWKAVIFPPHYPEMAKQLGSKRVDWSYRWDEPPRLFNGGLAFSEDSYMNKYLSLFERHDTVQSLFFFDHSSGKMSDDFGHWTLFYHSADGNVTCYDSSKQHSRKNIFHQLVLASFFSANRPKEPIHRSPDTDTNYLAIPVGDQPNSASCGHYAIGHFLWRVAGLGLRKKADQLSFRLLPLENVLRSPEILLNAYLSGEGVRVEHLIQAYANYDIDVADELPPNTLLVPSPSPSAEVPMDVSAVPQLPQSPLRTSHPKPATLPPDAVPSPPAPLPSITTVPVPMDTSIPVPMDTTVPVPMDTSTHPSHHAPSIDREMLLRHAEEDKRDERLIHGGIFKGEQLSPHEFWVLMKSNEYLNDEIINCFRMLLTHEAPEGHRTLILNTFFYAKIIDPDYPNEKLNPWLNKNPLLNYQYVVIPIHHKALKHWSVGVINLQGETFVHYDSLTTGSRARSNAFGNAMKPFMTEYHLATKKALHDYSAWKVRTPNKIPKQTDGTSCGVFSCFFMEAIVKNQDLESANFDPITFRYSMLVRMASAMISSTGSLGSSVSLGGRIGGNGVTDQIQDSDRGPVTPPRKAGKSSLSVPRTPNTPLKSPRRSKRQK